jgi:hypothetical protein
VTIAQVASQSGGVTTDSSDSVSRAYGSNVTAGNLVYVVCIKYVASGTPADFVAGDCTKSSGTATLGTIALDKQFRSTIFAVGIWSAIVSGSGSCTMQVSKNATEATNGDYWALGTDELSATTGWNSSRVEDSQTGTGTSTTQTTADLTTASGGAFVGGTTLDTGNNETTYAADGAFTQIYREPDGTAHAVGLSEIRISASGLTDAVSTTTSGSVIYHAAGVVYKEVSPGGGDVLASQILL